MKKRVHWLMACMGLALVLAGCGPAEPIVEVPAGEVNLTAADLGDDYSQEMTAGMEEMTEWFQLPEAGSTALDANMRIFGHTEGTVQLIAAVVVYNGASSARAGLRDSQQNLETALQQELGLPALSLDEGEPPELGDEAVYARTDELEDGSRVYFLGFRVQNVAGVLVAWGSADAVDADWLQDLGQMMASRVPALVEE